MSPASTGRFFTTSTICWAKDKGPGPLCSAAPFSQLTAWFWLLNWSKKQRRWGSQAALCQPLEAPGSLFLWSDLATCLALKWFFVTPKRRVSQTGPVIPASWEGRDVRKTSFSLVQLCHSFRNESDTTLGVGVTLGRKADWILPGSYHLVPGNLPTITTKRKPAAP